MKLYNVNGDILADCYTTPEMYGAVGDGIADDTNSLQKALNEKGLIVFGNGKKYKITGTLRIKKDTAINLNGSEVIYVTAGNQPLFANFTQEDVNFTQYNGNGNILICNGTITGGNSCFGHGKDISIKGVKFRNCLTAHFIEICGCKNITIDGCSFVGMNDNHISTYEYINLDPAQYNAFPYVPQGSAFFDGTFNDGLYISNCIFSVGEGDYSYGYNAVGVHGVNALGIHKDIVIQNTMISGFAGCGIRVNAMQNVFISGNRVDVVGDGVMVGDVASANNVIIIDNYINSNNGQMIVLTPDRYADVTISGNVAKGATN